MADPLSISSSIVAILQLTGSVVSYISDARGAPDDRRKLLTEISSVTGFLYLLKDSAERSQWDEVALNTMSSLSVSGGPLDQFKAALLELVTKLAPINYDHSISSKVTVNISLLHVILMQIIGYLWIAVFFFTSLSSNLHRFDCDSCCLIKILTMPGVKRARKVLSWPFQKGEAQNILARIERQKSMFILALQHDNLGLSRSIHEELSRARDGIETINEALEETKRRLADRDVQDVLDWLSPIKFWAKQTNIFDKRQPRTGT